MKVFKRALSLVIVLAMAMTSVAFAAFTDVADDHPYAEAIGVGTSLGLFTGYEDGSFLPDGDITRAEFAAIVTRMLNGESVASKQATPFTDVTADHWASGYINFGVGKGIINGMGDGSFAPDANVTYDQAMKMLVVALGYSAQLGANPVFPTDYLAVGSSIGLANGVNGTVDVPATRGQVAQMVYNALDVPLMMKTGYGTYEEWKIQDGYDDTTRKTVLSEYFNVVKLRGIVESTTQFSSSKDVTVKFKIDNNYDTKYDDEFPETTSSKDSYKNLLVGESGIANYVGYEVIAYVLYDSTSNDDPEVLFVKSNASSSDEITIDIDDLELVGTPVYNDRVDGYTVEYWGDSTSKTEKIIVDAAATVMVNGISTTVDIEDLFTGNEDGDATDDLLAGKAGTITFLLSGESDSDYNKIFINSYINFVVDYVDTEDMVVIAKAYGESDIDEEIVYDPSETDYRASLVDENGNALDWESLQENDVLSIKVSSDKITVVDAVLVSSTVEGTITEKDDSGNATRYKIDGTWYKADDATVPGTLKLDDAGTFYLDRNGNIAYFEKTAGSKGNYAYIIAVDESAGSFDASIDLKLFTAEGEVITVASTEKIKVDGNSTSVQSQTTLTGEDAIAAGQFVTYKMNASGKITAIARPEVASINSHDDKDFAVTSATAEDDVFYKASQSKLDGLNVKLDDSTAIIVAPVDADDDDDYEVILASTLVDDQELDGVFAYDVDSNSKIAGAILITVAPTIVSAEDGMATLFKISEANDAEGNRIAKFTSYQNGEEVVLEGKDDDDYGLTTGQAFMPQFDGLGRVKGIQAITSFAREVEGETVTSYAKDVIPTFAMGELTGVEYEYNDDVTYFYGYAVEKTNSEVAITATALANGDEAPTTGLEYIPLNGVDITIVDGTLSSSLRVQDGSASDVRAKIDSDGNVSYGTKDNTSKIANMIVVAREYEGDVTDIVVYIVAK